MRLTKKQKSLLLSLLILIVLFTYSFLTGKDPVAFLYPSPTPTTAPSNHVLESPTSSPSVKSVVTRVIDGDTIEINGNQTIRYIGIDTPETVDPRREVQCFGREAAEKNKELVLNKEVILEKDVSETDRYGRLLRYVYVDGKMINELLVREGYATARSYPPDVKYQELLRGAEREARENKRGLWSSCKL